MFRIVVKNRMAGKFETHQEAFEFAQQIVLTAKGERVYITQDLGFVEAQIKTFSYIKEDTEAQEEIPVGLLGEDQEQEEELPEDLAKILDQIKQAKHTNVLKQIDEFASPEIKDDPRYQKLFDEKVDELDRLLKSEFQLEVIKKFNNANIKSEVIAIKDEYLKKSPDLREAEWFKRAYEKAYQNTPHLPYKAEEATV